MIYDTGRAAGATRRRILTLLKTEGPASAEELGRVLSISPVAVRQHLSGMESEGLVTSAVERRNVGRPLHRYSISPRGDETYPRQYAELMLDLLDEVAVSDGPGAIAGLFRKRTCRTVQHLAPRFAGRSLRERVAQLETVQSEHGYMPAVTSEGENSYRMVQHNCSVCRIAKAHPSLCEAELQMMRDLMGSDVNVERVEHILCGSRHCTFTFKQVE